MTPADQDQTVAPAATWRHILLAVTGLTPQVVTETICALWLRNPSLVPTEVHLITTLRGAEHARLNLLSPAIDWLGRLRREYALLLDEQGKTLGAFGLRNGMLPDYFNTKNSKLNKTLKDKLGALAARPYLILQDTEASGYALALTPAAIHYAAVPAPENDN